MFARRYACPVRSTRASERRQLCPVPSDPSGETLDRGRNGISFPCSCGRMDPARSDATPERLRTVGRELEGREAE
jgi:hypothetical protein